MNSDGIGGLVRLEQRVLRVEHEVLHGAVVGVHHDLHRVAQVVHAALRRRVRVARGGGVGVLYPPQAAVGDDHVRVVVQGEEGRRGADARADVVADDDAALALDGRRGEELDGAELRREREAVEQRRDGDAAAPRVVGVHVAVGARVVELLVLGLHEAVAGAALAVVDARLRDLEARHALRRDVLHEEVRGAVAGHLVHGRHGDAEAVRVGDVLVDPRLGLRRQAVDVELARREHRLAVHAVHGVAVHVGVEERVVRPQLLQLPVAGDQGVGIPQADVAQRGLVVCQLLRRERRLGREAAG